MIVRRNKSTLQTDNFLADLQQKFDCGVQLGNNLTNIINFQPYMYNFFVDRKAAIVTDCHETYFFKITTADSFGGCKEIKKTYIFLRVKFIQEVHLATCGG